MDGRWLEALVFFLELEHLHFLFLIISSPALLSLGSYPSLITKSSRALVLVSLAKDDIPSMFICEFMLFREASSLEVVIDEFVKVE